MNYPPVLNLADEQAYERYYFEYLCSKMIVTFDGIRVYFAKGAFKHAFYKSSDRKNPSKDVFAKERAERMHWIECALKDSEAELYVGWNKKKGYEKSRRVALIVKNYAVIICIKNDKKAFFITAYLCDESTVVKIKAGPRWK